MPNYDFECMNCHNAQQLFIPLKDFREKLMEYCALCDRVTPQKLVILNPASVDDWGKDGQGKFFEMLGKNGMHFRDQKSYKKYLRDHGLVEWGPKTGMPGCEV